MHDAYARRAFKQLYEQTEGAICVAASKPGQLTPPKVMLKFEPE
jgi:hypothetical protein